MSNDAYQTVLNLVQRLSTDEQFQLLEDLAALLRKDSQLQQSTLEPKGLGNVYRIVLNQVRQLSTDEQFQMLEDLAVMVRRGTTRKPKHSIRELEGLGKELWEGVDVEEYIRQIRGSWEPENSEMKIHSSSHDLRQQTNNSLQEDKNVEPLISTIAEEIVQKMNSVDTENRYLQVWNILREYMRQKQISLTSAENTNLWGRDIG